MRILDLRHLALFPNQRAPNLLEARNTAWADYYAAILYRTSITHFLSPSVCPVSIPNSERNSFRKSVQNWPEGDVTARRF